MSQAAAHHATSSARRRGWKDVGERLGLAALVAAGAITIRAVLLPVLGLSGLYSIYAPAILLATWFGGWLGGMLCLLLCGLASVGMYLFPLGVYHGVEDLAGLGVFSAVGLVLIAMVRAQALARRKMAAAASVLHATEARERDRVNELEAMMEAMPSPMWIAHDPQCRRITGNRAANDLLGVNSGANLSRHDGDALARTGIRFRRDGHPTDVMPMHEAAATGQPIIGAEVELLYPAGHSRYIFGNALPLRDDRGTVRGCLGTFIDVTERKHAEHRLAFEHKVTHILTEVDSLEQAAVRILQATCEGNHAHIAQLWQPDATGQHLMCSAAWVEPGVEVAAFRSLSESTTFVPGRGLPGRVWTTRAATTIRDLEKDGNFPRIRAALGCGLQSGLAFPIAAGGEFFGVIEFFTHRKVEPERALLNTMTSIGYDIAQFIRRRRAEIALRRSEQNLEDFFENAAVGLHWIGPDGIILRANKTELNMLGYAPEEYLGRHIAEFHVDQDAITDMLVRLARGETLVNQPARMRCKDGAIKHVLIDSNVLWENGQFIHSRCFTRDVTEQKRAEQALRSSADEYRAMFELAGAGKAQSDPQSGRFVRVNQRLCEMTGYEADQLLEKAFLDITHPDDRPADRREFDRMVRGEIKEYASEKRYIREDGQVIWVLVTTSIVRDAAGRPRHTVSVILDVTDRKRAERELEQHRHHLEELVIERTAALEESHRQLRESERLVSLGTLAAGLGHDIGNLILPVMCRLDALAAGASEAVQRDLLAARQAVAQLRHMSNGLRLFAMDPHDVEASAGTTNLPTWWAQTGALLQRALPRHVPLEVQMADDLPDVDIAPHQLTHAVLNLLTNAGEAVGPQGRVRISAAHASDDAVRLSVTDNGQGMSDDIRRHALEPFFTTKTRSLSTGLGLSMVHGVMQSVGGSVQIQSRPRRGTTVTLTLPVLRELVDDTSTQSQPPLARVTLRDPRVASYAHTLLQSSGFAVCDESQAVNQQAVLWITEQGAHSLESVQNFLRERPDRRVIVVEGRSSENRMRGVHGNGEGNQDGNGASAIAGAGERDNNRERDGARWQASGIALVDGSYRTMRKALEQAWTEVRKGVMT